MSVFLIGYRGTGKTTVARLLAERWGWQAADSDDLVEALAGTSISAIFAERGEDAFRELETRALAELVTRERTVVSLGGGAVLREANRQLLQGRGPIICLTASPAMILARLAHDPLTRERRPNLTAAGGITEIIATLDARSPIYQLLADFQVDTTDRSPAEVADAIVARASAAP